MRIISILLFALLITLLSACEKDKDTKPTVNPTIQFLTGDGYTYSHDTVPTSHTLHVGVLIDRGTDAMHHFKVTVSYDGTPALVTDSLPMGTDQFEFQKTIITRDQAGTEQWSFNVIENDGDVIRRSLTFTVE